ncbi:25009_t:CDS:2 [Cetraspora pellucida]|uniref:25009_t:CDS:1 n=1 Tax=Cetraspora pellucida TaxID=1433469 RepID=A0A9N8YW94_9GLOM|nr:25009_t:CDS:2 [Cetraspora pellucida]
MQENDIAELINAYYTNNALAEDYDSNQADNNITSFPLNYFSPDPNQAVTSELVIEIQSS